MDGSLLGLCAIRVPVQNDVLTGFRNGCSSTRWLFHTHHTAALQELIDILELVRLPFDAWNSVVHVEIFPGILHVVYDLCI